MSSSAQKFRPIPPAGQEKAARRQFQYRRGGEMLEYYPTPGEVLSERASEDGVVVTVRCPAMAGHRQVHDRLDMILPMG